MLEIEGLSFTYSGRRTAALHNLSLALKPGVYGLAGVNGAGKSTLLQVLARILHPSEGSVTLWGEDMHRAKRSSVAKRVAYMPQDFALPGSARVLDSLAHLAWLKGVPPGQARHLAQAALQEVGLLEVARDQIRQLSGGMVRRLAFSQTLLTKVDVVLLDEPTTGLDPEQRSVVRELVTHNEGADTITIISSHLMEDLEALVSRLIVINSGRVMFEGSMEDFRTKPDGLTESAESAFLRHLSRHQ